MSPPRPAGKRVPWVLSLWKGPTWPTIQCRVLQLDCCYCCFHLLVSNLSSRLHNAKNFTLIKISPTHINNREGMKLFCRRYSSFIHSAISLQGSTSNILDPFLCLRLWPPHPHHSPAWQWSQAADGFISFLLKVSHLCLILAASCKPELILNASGKIHCTGEMLTNKYSRLHNWHRTCSNCMEFVKGSRLDQESQTEYIFQKWFINSWNT